MNSLRPLAYAVATMLVLGAGVNATAQERHEFAAGAAPITTTLTPKERGDLTRQFVRKWGNYVQQIYGMDVHSWASRMVGTFATADPINFQRALRRSTFEGAMATLDGSGHKLSDDKVIDVLAANNGKIGPYVFGDVDQDLVFTAVEPCRIVDTRGTTAGAITGGTSRGFYAWGYDDYVVQGGSNTDCGGLLNQSPQAIVVNFTVVSPSQTGYATLYPYEGVPPLAANMVYHAGVTLSNSATVPLGSINNIDFQIFSERTAQYVVDIVGYYDAPHATALECFQTTGTPVSIAANGTGSSSAQACASGYTRTGIDCVTGNSSTYIYGLADGICSANNLAASTSSVLATSTCCRVPGR